MVVIDVQSGKVVLSVEGSAHKERDPSERARTQREDAAAILRLAAYRAEGEWPRHLVDTLVHRALSHLAAAERIERGEA